MTLNDPIQGILVRRPETLFFVDKARPALKKQAPRTDRLQGIVFAGRSGGPSLGSAKLNGTTILPELTPERIREVDSLTITELEELTAGMVIAAGKQEAAIVRNPRHGIIHSIRLPLRSRNN